MQNKIFAKCFRFNISLKKFAALFALLNCTLLCFADTSTTSVISNKFNIKKEHPLSTILLRNAYETAKTSEAKSKAAYALGVSYLESQLYPQAEPLLKEVFDLTASDDLKALCAIHLGDLSSTQKNVTSAITWYKSAISYAPQNNSVQLDAGIRLAGISQYPLKFKELERLTSYLPFAEDKATRAKYALIIATLARRFEKNNTQATRLTYENLLVTKNLGEEMADHRIQAESFDGLSGLYEEQLRHREALQLANDGVSHAQAIQARDLLISLEWRRGRLFRAIHDDQEALNAYQRAVDHVEAIRQDIPVEYQDGKSSFRETLEPLYLGLADLLLSRKNNNNDEQRDLYTRARQTLELMKQSELEDFLGDRCAVEARKNTAISTLPDHTALLYPIILPDRLELLRETREGFKRVTINVTSKELQATIDAFSLELRNAFSDYKPDATRLYNWLLKPLEEYFKNQNIIVTYFHSFFLIVFYYF